MSDDPVLVGHFRRSPVKVCDPIGPMVVGDAALVLLVTLLRV